MDKKDKRIYYLDVLRVIACLSVILIHASAEYAIKNIESSNFLPANIIDGLARIAVPLFVMISGALLLDEKYDFNIKKHINHILKLIAFYLFWSTSYSIIYKVIKPLIRHKPIRIVKIIGSILSGHFHLWFIYLIIGLYLILPLLRLWVNDKNKKYVEYYLILALIFTFLIPQLTNIACYYYHFFERINDILNNKLILSYVGGYTSYFILGWYINNYELKHKKLIYILGIISFLITGIGTYFLSIKNGEYVETMYNNLTINVLFQTITIFIFIKDKYKNKKESNKIINSISKYSLGIYATHVIILKLTSSFLTRNNMNNALINIPIIFLVSFILAYITSFILSKIPLLKKVV